MLHTSPTLHALLQLINAVPGLWTKVSTDLIRFGAIEPLQNANKRLVFLFPIGGSEFLLVRDSLNSESRTLGLPG